MLQSPAMRQLTVLSCKKSSGQTYMYTTWLLYAGFHLGGRAPLIEVAVILLLRTNHFLAFPYEKMLKNNRFAPLGTISKWKPGMLWLCPSALKRIQQRPVFYHENFSCLFQCFVVCLWKTQYNISVHELGRTHNTNNFIHLHVNVLSSKILIYDYLGNLH